MIINTSPETQNNVGLHRRSKKQQSSVIKENLQLLLLALPAIIYYFVWQYLPMFGLVLAFKKLNYEKGILGGPWVGLENFKFFFASQDAWRITRNTVGYSITFIILNIVAAVTIALLMYEINRKFFIKFFQTTMILPRFMSWVIVGYITYAFLNPTHGIFNQMFNLLGISKVNWYADIKFWPFILIFAELWKGVGLNSIMYYASLMGADESLYESARMDGANRWQQTLHISIPHLVPLMTILGLLSLGNIFRGDFGLFYQIPMDIGILYPVTDIIDTYIYRGLSNGQYTVATAVGLFQSFVGLGCILMANWAVRKIDPEKSLF